LRNRKKANVGRTLPSASLSVGFVYRFLTQGFP
jgi:hypothetical protein